MYCLYTINRFLRGLDVAEITRQGSSPLTNMTVNLSPPPAPQKIAKSCLALFK